MCLIELQNRNKLVVHEDVAAAVDAQLRGRPLPVEIRTRNSAGEIEIENVIPERPVGERIERERSTRMTNGNGNGNGNGRVRPRSSNGEETSQSHVNSNGAKLAAQRLYAYGVARNRLQQSAKRLHVPATIVDDFAQADAIVTLKNYYRRRPKLVVDAERRGTPIYVLRANTVSQIESFLIDLYGLEDERDPFGQAIEEAKAAIIRVRGGANYVDLMPQPGPIRRRQHELAQEAELFSESYGQEPLRHVRNLARIASSIANNQFLEYHIGTCSATSPCIYLLPRKAERGVNPHGHQLGFGSPKRGCRWYHRRRNRAGVCGGKSCNPVDKNRQPARKEITLFIFHLEIAYVYYF